MPAYLTLGNPLVGDEDVIAGVVRPCGALAHVRVPFAVEGHSAVAAVEDLVGVVPQHRGEAAQSGQPGVFIAGAGVGHVGVGDWPERPPVNTAALGVSLPDELHTGGGDLGAHISVMGRR